MINLTVPIYWYQSKVKKVMLGLNWYNNANSFTSNRAKKKVLKDVYDSTEGNPILNGTIHVHYKIYIKNKSADGGNIRSVIEKFVLDALKKCEYITEYNAKIIVSSSDEYHFDIKNPRAEIILLNKKTEKEELKKILLNLI